MPKRTVMSTELGKILAIRVFAKAWILKLGGKNNNWCREDVTALGHTIVRLQVSPPTKSSIVDNSGCRLVIGAMNVDFGTMERATFQFKRMPEFNISSDDDFNSIYPVLHKAFPNVVNNDKPLIITSMITKDPAGNLFVWERHNVGVTGKSAWRMLLMTFNGIDVTGMSQAEQMKTAGAIIEDLCEIRAAVENKSSCLLSIKS